MELFNLEVLESLTKEEQINIKIGIIETNPLETIPVVYLPEVTQRDYYFVSYSHLDYVEVYKDIFDLQLKGLSIWYDRGIPAGENWKDFAMKYMTPFDCKGALFYLSENALISESIIEEIAFAKETNKPFITILISKNSESLSEMIERLHREGKIDNKKYDFYIKTFPKEIIYLDYNCDCATKAEKIGASIQRTAKLDLDERVFTYVEKVFLKYGFRVRGLNDYYAKQVVLQDYFDLFTDERLKKKVLKNTVANRNNFNKTILNYLCSKTFVIGIAAFANMKNLELVEFPNCNIIISDYAFYRCENLSKICLKRVLSNLKDVFEWDLGDGAFFGCKSLKEVELASISSIGEYCFCGCSSLTKINLFESYAISTIEQSTFRNCSSLKTIILPSHLDEIGDSAFQNTAIKELDCPDYLGIIGDYAFSECKKLKKVSLNKRLKTIGKFSFRNCKSLNEITLPSSLEQIGRAAFDGCNNLKKIVYEGTIQSSIKLIRRSFFGYETEPKTIKIVCSDGEYELSSGNDVYEQIKDDISERDFCSVSYIQRTFGIGFPKAGELFNKLIEDGYVERNSKDVRGSKVLIRKGPRPGSFIIVGDKK